MVTGGLRCLFVDLFEYQARDLLASHGVPVLPGGVAETPEEAEAIAREIARPYVGRTLRGVGRSPEAAREAAMTKAIGEINGKYMARTQIPSSRVNELFDRITRRLVPPEAK